MSAADIPIAGAMRKLGMPCASAGTTLSPRTFLNQEAVYEYSCTPDQPDMSSLVIFVQGTAPELYQNWQAKSQFYRCYWQVCHAEPISLIPYCVWAATEQEVGSPEDLAVSTVPFFPTQRPATDEETPWRGVFSGRTPHKNLFSQSLEIRISELPRWKPRVNPWGRASTDE